jgi:hypothetical protein
MVSEVSYVEVDSAVTSTVDIRLGSQWTRAHPTLDLEAWQHRNAQKWA